MHRLLPLLFIFLLPACTSEAQQSSDASGDMTIEKFEPRSSLVVEENIVTRAKYPFVDVHSHWFRAPTMTEGAIDTLMMEMDGMNKSALFIEDHIHLSQQGRLYAAQRIAQTMQQRGILETESSK